VVGFGAMPIGTPVGRSVAITAYRVPDAVQRRDPCDAAGRDVDNGRRKGMGYEKSCSPWRARSDAIQR
jgi:hypothetical protein